MSDEPKPPEPSHQPEPSVTEPGSPVTEPGSPVTEPAAPARNRKRTVAIVLAVVLGVLTVLCCGGLGAGYFLYRQASEPDRTTPGVALRQYLDAALNERDDSRARLFVCSEGAALDQLRQLRDDIKNKETQYGVTIRTSPEDFNAQESGTNATVGVKLRMSVSTNGTFQEQIQAWRFSLKKESGWRVCGAEQTG